MATVLITGANRGLGLEFTRQLLARGNRVHATCRRIDAAAELVALQQANSALQLHELDVSDLSSLSGFPQKLQGDPIDLFINNAGVYGPRDSRFGKVDADKWLDAMKVNTVAPLLLTQALIENLRKGKDKKLIYLSSKMGSIDDNSGGGSYVYRSSKTALNSVVKSIAVDLGKEEFISVVLHPGWVQTDMGGPNALIDVGTSVKGMLKLIDGLTAEQSGGFYNYDGATIPW